MPAEIFRSADLSVRTAFDFGSETCVITFDSYSDDRNLDRNGFGQDFFASRQIDAVHFVSRENDWYQYAELPEVTARVADLVKGYPRVVAYGSSMGGYGAIRFGGMAGASEALAISPQFSIDPRVAKFERRWKDDSDRIDFSLERTLKSPFVKRAYIVYDPRDLDRRHADLFRRHSHVIDIPLPNAGHPATGSMAEAEVLSEFVMQFVAGRVDIAEITRRMMERQESTPQFHYVMSERARSPRDSIASAAKAAEMAPDHFGFATHYASLLAANQRFAEAEIAFARAATISPDHPVLLYKLTEFHEQRGDLESAIETAEVLVSLHSERFRPRLAQLEALRDRRARPRWSILRSAARRIAGDPALPVDVRVTTTPSPPPFAESWRRHDALMAARPGGPFDVFVVGDSLVEYWPDELWAPLSVFNFGVRADKTQHALWRLGELPAGSIDCRHAVILLGTNNLGADDTASGVAAGVAAVVAGVVRVAPRAKLWVIATPPCGPQFEFRADVRREANATLAAFSGFETINEDALLMSRTQGCSCYDPDNIHFSRPGYVQLTRAVMDRLG